MEGKWGETVGENQGTKAKATTNQHPHPREIEQPLSNTALPPNVYALSATAKTTTHQAKGKLSNREGGKYEILARQQLAHIYSHLTL
jgi:hypothetical protein